ncbi:MAG: hypothetical protein PVF74_06935 [Anaerolineales bacterium]
MSVRPQFKRLLQIALIVFISALFLAGTHIRQSVSARSENAPSASDPQLLESKSANAESLLYLPVLVYNHPWASPFGSESNAPIVDGSTMLERAVELDIKWARMGTQIHWNELQPNPGDPIQWHLLETFEDELHALRAAGITPIVIIKDSPHWAVVQDARTDGKPTTCAPIATEYLDEFADFVSQLVYRYKTPEFNVHHWELFNEPDVDPDLVPVDFLFGCWGDIDDIDYYGGKHYGEMLKVITPMIKSIDPQANVHIGGLLLANPDSPPGQGKPENFLKGILAAGAAPYFDVVPYHWHPSYGNVTADYDNAIGSAWDPLGGGTVGKARYLRQLMSDFGVDKPLFLNESGFGCKETDAWCVPPDSQFFENQADYLVRSYTRGLSENLMGMVWYALSGPGWRDTGLLDASQNPRPSYDAYKVLIALLRYGKYQAPIDYGAGIEAYEFRRKLERVHVLWANDAGVTSDVLVPDANFLAAYDRDGTLLTPPLIGPNRQISVGFSPVYILLNP